MSKTQALKIFNYSLVPLLFFVVVIVFQNCGKQQDIFDVGSPAVGNVSVSLKVYGSNQIVRTCFEIGEIINLDVTTNPSSQKVAYTLRRNNAFKKSSLVTTPATVQEVPISSVNDIGDYVALTEVKEGARVVATKSINFSVKPRGQCSVESCLITTPNGTNYSLGDAVVYEVTSNIVGGGTVYFIREENQFAQENVGTLNSGQLSFSRSVSQIGIFERSAEVLKSDGTTIVACTPQSLSVTVATAPSPSPGTSLTPTPTPSPTPGTASGLVRAYNASPGVSDCPIVLGGSYPNFTFSPCTATITWQGYNTSNVQVWYRDSYENTLTFISCGLTGSTTHTLNYSDLYVPNVVDKFDNNRNYSRTYYLYDGCNQTVPPTGIPLSTTQPIIWHVGQ